MFSQKTIDFLVENRLMNSKAWYGEHKDEYRRYVLEPMAELVTALAPTILGIDEKLICEPKVDRSISRIYRDTRFSKDKSLYRDNAWCVFIRDKKLYEGPPAFFFEISPGGFRYGCGYYEASSASIESVRRLILAGSPIFRQALGAYENQSLFNIEGEYYKKSKYPEQPENLRKWLDAKGFSLIHNSTDFDVLFSESLPDTLSKGFKILEPVYGFLMKAEEEKAAKG